MTDGSDDRANRETRGQSAKPRVRLDANARRRIGQGLRLHYASLIAQPLPERFEALLTDLAGRTKSEEPSR